MQALVIDDSRAMRRIVCSILGNLGFATIEAGDGRAALDTLTALEERGSPLPELACVDWNMPVMDGLAFVTAVRANRAWRDLTMMMVTTESEHDRVVRALAAGAHEYMIKPFTADAFADKLALLGLVPAGASS